MKAERIVAAAVVAPEAALMAVSDVCIATARAVRMFRMRLAQETTDNASVQTVIDEYVKRKNSAHDPMDFMAPMRDSNDDRAPGGVEVS